MHPFVLLISLSQGESETLTSFFALEVSCIDSFFSRTLPNQIILRVKLTVITVSID